MEAMFMKKKAKGYKKNNCSSLKSNLLAESVRQWKLLSSIYQQQKYQLCMSKLKAIPIAVAYQNVLWNKTSHHPTPKTDWWTELVFKINFLDKTNGPSATISCLWGHITPRHLEKKKQKSCWQAIIQSWKLVLNLLSYRCCYDVFITGKEFWARLLKYLYYTLYIGTSKPGNQEAFSDWNLNGVLQFCC